MKLTLGFSPCPNDCFIFDALVHKKIDTEGLDIEVILEDVETLNRKAMKGELDITKLSFHAFGYVLEKYILLKAGSALGFNCGPLLISKNAVKDIHKEIKTVAIPGKLTTANFLLGIAFPEIKNKKEYVFSEIEDAVLKSEVDAGLIIHENRFTYEQKGLKKVMDLGEFWDSLIHAPIPLGGIVIKRSLGEEVHQRVNRLVRKSVEYAFANPGSSMPYVRQHAQTMSEEVMKKHIDLYVNEFSVDLGEKGTEAIRLMFEKAKKQKLFDIPEVQVIIDGGSL
jgi:1,4-dihydroxy-6-naphthoate synthase